MAKSNRLNHQWVRAFGSNLDPGNQKRMNKNTATMNNPVFINACMLAGISVTRRQAGKWNNGKGIALRFKYAAAKKG